MHARDRMVSYLPKMLGTQYIVAFGVVVRTTYSKLINSCDSVKWSVL